MGHQFTYDFEALRDVLGVAGFDRITKRAFRQGFRGVAHLDMEDSRRVGSLYVEAEKS